MESLDIFKHTYDHREKFVIIFFLEVLCKAPYFMCYFPNFIFFSFPTWLFAFLYDNLNAITYVFALLRKSQRFERELAEPQFIKSDFTCIGVEKSYWLISSLRLLSAKYCEDM